MRCSDYPRHPRVGLVGGWWSPTPAELLGLDPLDVITRNLVPAEAFPYRTASGALLDSGNYQEAIRRGVKEGGLAELKSRRDAAD